MVCPDIDLTMSPGRWAVPEGMFSVRPIRPNDIDGGLAHRERVHEAGDTGGAAHVALHVLHAGRRASSRCRQYRRSRPCR